MGRRRKRRKIDNNEAGISFSQADSEVVRKFMYDFHDMIEKSSQQQSKDLSIAFADEIIEPSLPFYDVAHVAITNTWHARCIEIKSIVSMMSGWEITTKEQEDEGKEAERLAEILDESCSHSKACHHNFESFLVALAIDYITLGNAYYEVVRDGTGKIIELYHVPALTVRKRKGDENNQNNGGYWQLAFLSRDIGETAFTTSNVPSSTKQTFNLLGGATFSKVYFKEYKDDRVWTVDGRQSNNVPIEEQANELVHIKDYHPLSPIYGIPSWLACFSAIIGDEAADKYNISFFENNRVPRWLINLIGYNLKKAEEENLKLYVNEILRGRPHVPTIIHSKSQDSKIEIHKMDADVNEASFLDYRKSNRDEIISSHGVPPRMLGIITPGNLGGSGDAQKQREDFKSFTIQPLQKAIIGTINQYILPELGFEDYEVHMCQFDTQDSEEFRKMAESAKTLISFGVMTVNEARKKLGLPEIDDGWANKNLFIIGQNIFPASQLEEKQAEFVQDQEMNNDINSARKKIMQALDTKKEKSEETEEIEETEEENVADAS